MANKFAEFAAYSIIAIAILLFLALSVSISWWTLSWAFGLR